jgi:hypothetical protein
MLAINMSSRSTPLSRLLSCLVVLFLACDVVVLLNDDNLIADPSFMSCEQDKYNSPEYVVRVRDAVVGDINWAIVSNYLYDMDWLLKEIPKLRDIPCVSLLYHKDNFNSEFVLPTNFTIFAPYVEVCLSYLCLAL